MPAGDAGLERQTCEVCREIDHLQAQLAAQQAVIEGFIRCAEQRYWPSAERIEAARRALDTVAGPSGDTGLEQGSVTLLPDTYSAMQAVVDAARQRLASADESWRELGISSKDTPELVLQIDPNGHWAALRGALAALDKAQAAQPEGEPR